MSIQINSKNPDASVGAPQHWGSNAFIIHYMGSKMLAEVFYQMF